MTLKKRSSSVFTLALLLFLVGVPKASADRLSLLTTPFSEKLTANFSLPDTVAQGTQVKVDGSTSMQVVNQALKQQFESKFSGTSVNLNYAGADAGVAAVLEGKADLAAIGRTLTEAEKAQDLIEVPVSRNKIAILIGKDNPFAGSLTTVQFAKIFRGEITDWSEVGGTPGAIRLVDRPATSDTRAAFNRYPVFQGQPFEAAVNATKLTEDTTEAVIKELGTDGIGYAIANQSDQSGAKIVPMHKVLPDDPRYPFSQPLSYIYKGPNASPGVAAFLGYATDPLGQQAIAAGQTVAAVASGTTASIPPSPVNNPADSAAAGSTAADSTAADSAAAGSTAAGSNAAGSTVASSAPNSNVATLPPGSGGEGGLPPWLAWLLLIPVLGWLLRSFLQRQPEADATLPAVPPREPSSAELSSGAPESELAARAGSVISADRVSIQEVNNRVEASPAEPVAEFVAEPVAEIPAPVTEPVAEPGADMGAAIAGAVGTAGASAAMLAGLADMPEADLPVEETPVEESIEESTAAPVSEPTEERPESEAQPNANWAAAAGAVGAAGVAGAAMAGAAFVAANREENAQTTAEAARYDVGQTDLSRESLASVDEGLADLPDGYGESQIVLVSRDPHWAYAYWDVPSSHREAVRRQGGNRLALRLYDVTDVDLSSQKPYSLQQFECEEFAREWYLPVPVSDRDYWAEIGYLSDSGEWLMLARSLPIRIPPLYPSDWVDDQEATVNWDEDLKGKTFLELFPPNSPGVSKASYLFDLTQSTEAQRQAGSLFGSMQQVSSFITQSGVGMSGVGMSGVGMSGVGMSGVGMSGVGMMGFPGFTLSGVGMSGVGMYPGYTMSGVGMSGVGMFSGLNMSGIGMSGIGMMSGVGFSASAPPIRPRQFWLVADAELIVYGATEPDATVTIGGQPIQLNPDGTFRIQLSFQDGVIDFPIMAVAVDGEQNRAIHMTFTRETPTRRTNTKDEAQEEWDF